MSYILNYRLLRGSLSLALSLSAVGSLALNGRVIAALPDKQAHATTYELTDLSPTANKVDIKAIAQANYGKLPTSFIANAGQIDPAVRFEVSSSAGSLFFTPGGVTLSLPTRSNSVPQSNIRSRTVSDKSAATRDPQSAVAIRLTFMEANPKAAIEGTDLLPGTANFFIGNDKSQWHTGVKTYAGVAYRDLYPGIDLAYTGHAGTLKGTYTVAAGADPSAIHWQYNGADSIAMDTSAGSLEINAGKATLTEQVPEAWQLRADGTQASLAASYQVDSGGTAKFAFGSYDHMQPLIIDPGLVYSTYFGGTGVDEASGIAVDVSGNAYMSGFTYSTNFPVTTGVYQSAFGGGVEDAFVSKLNPAGNVLLFSTFLGGSNRDLGNAIAVDHAGYVYVAGETLSSNFPTTAGAYQITDPGTDVGFVTELRPDGASLYYSTYLGSSGGSYFISGIAVDSSYNAYLVGGTDNNNFPTVNAFQSALSGPEDAFVTKLNASGSGLVYSTYLGGSQNENGTGITVNSAGNAFVVGDTSSTDFPLTLGAYQTGNGGGYDVFVTKFTPSGSALAYSTYIGGSQDDTGASVALDAAGFAYVTGATSSANFPVTSGAYQTTLKGGQNAFVTQLAPNGTALYYSTYLGGNASDSGTGIAVDKNYQAVIIGNTSSSNFPTTASAFQTTYNGNTDAFVTKLNSLGTGLLLSTYLGGSAADYGIGIALDSNGDSYVAGYSLSTNFPLYRPIQASNAGSFDAFVTKLNTLDGLIDSIGIYRAGKFYLRLHNSTGNADITVAFTAGTKPYPVVGDWTGAGFDTIGVYDQSNGQFSLRNSNTAGAPDEQFVLGVPNDQPLSGRWLLNATNAGVGVFRPTNGLIYLKNTLATGYADYTMVLGIPGDVGLAGDWNGKGFDSPGVYRPSNSTFYMSNQVKNGSVFGDFQAQYGVGGDVPVIGDWVAQAHDGIGLFRQSNGFTYLKNTLATGYADNTFTYGIAGDVPVAGHWQLTYPPNAPIGHSVPPAVLIAKTPIPGSGSTSVFGASLIGD